jgi:hypothetical protein
VTTSGRPRALAAPLVAAAQSSIGTINSRRGEPRRRGRTQLARALYGFQLPCRRQQRLQLSQPSPATSPLRPRQQRTWTSPPCNCSTGMAACWATWTPSRPAGCWSATMPLLLAAVQGRRQAGRRRRRAEVALLVAGQRPPDQALGHGFKVQWEWAPQIRCTALPLRGGQTRPTTLSCACRRLRTCGWQRFTTWAAACAWPRGLAAAALSARSCKRRLRLSRRGVAARQMMPQVQMVPGAHERVHRHPRWSRHRRRLTAPVPPQQAARRPEPRPLRAYTALVPQPCSRLRPAQHPRSWPRGRRSCRTSRPLGRSPCFSSARATLANGAPGLPVAASPLDLRPARIPRHNLPAPRLGAPRTPHAAMPARALGTPTVMALATWP